MNRCVIPKATEDTPNLLIVGFEPIKEFEDADQARGYRQAVVDDLATRLAETLPETVFDALAVALLAKSLVSQTIRGTKIALDALEKRAG